MFYFGVAMGLINFSYLVGNLISWVLINAWGKITYLWIMTGTILVISVLMIFIQTPTKVEEETLLAN